MKKVLCILAVLFFLAGGLWGWRYATRDRSGWLTEEGRCYYLDAKGSPVTGWQEIDGTRYCFAGDGTLRTGWHTVDGQRHYFLSDGIPAQGEMTVDGKTYRFTQDGIPHVGWLEEAGARRYFDGEGCLVTGAYTVEGVPCLFREDGTLVTGWYEERYYLENGALAQGWLTLDGLVYYFQEDGSAYHGWLQEGEYQYYLKADGTMAVGATEIDGEIRYFTPKGIHLWLVNPWNYLPEDYEVELVTSENNYPVAAAIEDALNQMLEGCRDAGLNPRLISGWRSYWDQQYLYQKKIAEYGYATGQKIVAKPNTSEHQLGLAVDVVDGSYRDLNAIQGTKPVQLWLMEHCWEYGFILRYPEGTTDVTGIIYEPWHYRYVGTEVSLEMKALGITLEEYLGAVKPE